jgi:rhamnogalacturonyl hydrolase YesR
MGDIALTSDLGLATNSTDLLKDSVKQFVGESGHILDEEKNIYHHVNQDWWGYPFWATGNGWMMYGIMRVVSFTHLSQQR